MRIDTISPKKPAYLPIVITLDTESEAKKLFFILSNAWPNDEDTKVDKVLRDLYQGLGHLLHL